MTLRLIRTSAIGLLAAVLLTGCGPFLEATQQLGLGGLLGFFGGGPADQNDNLTDDSDDDATPDDAVNDAAAKLYGTIVAPQSARKDPRRSENTDAPTYAVVVQSLDTLLTYTGQTDEQGAFQVEIPDSEAGSTFTVSFLTPAGTPTGTMTFGGELDHGYNGLVIDVPTNLGSILFPDDPSAAPIEPGSDADALDNVVDRNAFTRLNEAGAPLGAATFGRGDDALATARLGPANDADQDGMIDAFDADDDGDGILDDFDADAVLIPGLPAGLTLNFFMNLKLNDMQAQAYFDADRDAIDDSLQNDTVITFEVRGDPAQLGKNITAVRLIGPPSPGPSYLSQLTTLDSALWSDSGFALRPDGDNHFQEWAVPHDFLLTGDTFTVEITYDDGSVDVFNRMINYVFTSIPKLVNAGAPDALAPITAPGTIEFDGSQDLVLEWNPPVDDFGVQLTDLTYFFEVFYYDGDGNQINDIDPATWSTAISGFDNNRHVYEVSGEDLGELSMSDTFTAQLPADIFASTVQSGSGPVVVGSYKIDIAAQNGGNNAALMLQYVKH